MPTKFTWRALLCGVGLLASGCGAQPPVMLVACPAPSVAAKTTLLDPAASPPTVALPTPVVVTPSPVPELTPVPTTAPVETHVAGSGSASQAPSETSASP